VSDARHNHRHSMATDGARSSGHVGGEALYPLRPLARLHTVSHASGEPTHRPLLLMYTVRSVRPRVDNADQSSSGG